MSEPVVQYSHDRIGQRWTLRDHARLLEYVHQVNHAVIMARKGKLLPALQGAQVEQRVLLDALEARVRGL